MLWFCCLGVWVGLILPLAEFGLWCWKNEVVWWWVEKEFGVLNWEKGIKAHRDFDTFSTRNLGTTLSFIKKYVHHVPCTYGDTDSDPKGIRLFPTSNREEDRVEIPTVWFLPSGKARWKEDTGRKGGEEWWGEREKRQDTSHHPSSNIFWVDNRRCCGYHLTFLSLTHTPHPPIRSLARSLTRFPSTLFFSTQPRSLTPPPLHPLPPPPPPPGGHKSFFFADFFFLITDSMLRFTVDGIYRQTPLQGC